MKKENFLKSRFKGAKLAKGFLTSINSEIIIFGSKRSHLSTLISFPVKLKSLDSNSSNIFTKPPRTAFSRLSIYLSNLIDTDKKETRAQLGG